MHHDKPMLTVRIDNGRAAVLTDAMARLNVLLPEIGVDGQVFRRAQDLRLERAHLPIFPLFWTLMHVLDERSPLRGYDATRAIEADAQVLVTIKARDPMLSTTVHDLRSYSARETLRHALFRCPNHGTGRDAGFRPDQNRSAGARYRSPPGTGVDGTRRGPIDALSQAFALPVQGTDRWRLKRPERACRFSGRGSSHGRSVMAAWFRV